MAIKVNNTTVIDDSRVATVVDASINSLVLNGTEVAVEGTEINKLTGLTDNLQNQIDASAQVVGTLDRSFSTNETVTINLNNPINLAPVVSVTKEVPQENITNNDWDVAADGSNFTLHNTAYDTTLTPSNATGNGSFSLGTGSFVSTDVGKRIVGNGGEAVLTAADGSYELQTAFNNTSIIGAGDWSMFGLDIESGDSGLVLSESSSYLSFGADVFAYYDFEESGNDLTNNGNDLTEFNPVYAQDIPPNKSGSYSFYVADGDTDTYLSRETPVSMGSTDSDYSVSFWYKPETISGNRILFVLDSGDTLDVTGNESTDNTGLRVACYDGIVSATKDGFFSQYAAHSSTLNVDTWYHITATYNRSTETVSLYIDGTFSNSEIVKYNINTTDLYYLVGQEPDSFEPYGSFSGSQNAAGYIDKLAIYSKTLSDSEVTEIYNDDYSVGTTLISGYHTAITTVSTNTEFWTDINSMTADDSVNDGAVYYAVSTDDRTTWSIIDDTNGVRNIVRNNGGTWEVNDASDYGTETWVAATENDEFYALEEAVGSSTAQNTIGFAPADQWSYDSVSFDVSGQDLGPQSIAFNTNGTKLYVFGESSGSVYQYTLSTAFDISTASYDSVTFSVSGQDASAQSITFNADGTKMYMVGSNNDSVYQYSLSTAFDLSTASYDSVSFSVSGQDSTPFDIKFSEDGTHMYILGRSNNLIYQYSLSSAFDLSTASYDNVSFDISGQDTATLGIKFNNHGTKMYTVGSSSDSVYQYTLSTSFDLSTASYDSISFSVVGQDGTPTGITFNSEGTQMYMVGINTDSVYQYTTGSTTSTNRMDSTQLNAVSDANQYTLGNDLDLAITLFMDDGNTNSPTSDGVAINYDANVKNEGAVLGTDYDFIFSTNSKVQVTNISPSAENYKVKVI